MDRVDRTGFWALEEHTFAEDQCQSCGAGKLSHLSTIDGPQFSMQVCTACVVNYERVGWVARGEGLNSYEATDQWRRLYGELPPTTKEGELATESWQYEPGPGPEDERAAWERSSGIYGPPDEDWKPPSDEF